MFRLPPRATRPDTLVPCPPLFRSVFTAGGPRRVPLWREAKRRSGDEQLRPFLGGDDVRGRRHAGSQGEVGILHRQHGGIGDDTSGRGGCRRFRIGAEAAPNDLGREAPAWEGSDSEGGQLAPCYYDAYGPGVLTIRRAERRGDRGREG